MLRIDADTVLPGDAQPLTAASVLIEGDRIVYIGPTVGLPQDAPATPEVCVPVLMPGMWDVHAHLMGLSDIGLQSMVSGSYATAAVRAAKDAEVALMAGFTSLREAGGLGIWLVPAIEDGTIPGPSIYSAGSVISPTGGHAD